MMSSSTRLNKVNHLLPLLTSLLASKKKLLKLHKENLSFQSITFTDKKKLNPRQIFPLSKIKQICNFILNSKLIYKRESSIKLKKIRTLAMYRRMLKSFQTIFKGDFEMFHRSRIELRRSIEAHQDEKDAHKVNELLF